MGILTGGGGALESPCRRFRRCSSRSFDFDLAASGGSHSGSLRELSTIPYGRLGKGVFFPLTRSEKSSADSLIARVRRAEQPRFDHHKVFRGERALRRGDRVSRELGRNRHRACLGLGLIIGRSRSRRHALGFDWRGRGWGALLLSIQADGGAQDSDD